MGMLKRIEGAVERHPTLAYFVMAFGVTATYFGLGSIRTGRITDYNFPAGIEKYVDNVERQTISEKSAYDYIRNKFDENKDGKISLVESTAATQVLKEAVPFNPLQIVYPVPFNIRNTERNLFTALEKIKSEDVDR